MSDFECLPIGTAARLAQLEAEVERLREKLLIACNRGDVADAEVGRLQAEVERLRAQQAEDWKREAHLHKARADTQREELLRTWFVLKEYGHHPGRTDDRLSDCVRRALGPNAEVERLRAQQAEPAVELEQSEQEPLFVVEGGKLRPLRPALLNEGDKLYTAPPRRKWVPLTDQEVWSHYQRLWPFNPAEEPLLAASLIRFYSAIDAALKEKNHG